MAASLMLVSEKISCANQLNCERKIPGNIATKSVFVTDAFSIEPAASEMQMPIFGYAEFVGAMALLAVVYTITDLRYKFRARVAPIPLYKLTAIIATTVGAGALLSNYWFAEKLPIWHFLNSLALIQAVLGGLFLLLMCAWAYYVGTPAKYQRANCVKFISAINRRIIDGKKEELLMLAEALGDTAVEIVNAAPTANERASIMTAAPVLSAKQSFKANTNDLLFMLASPRMAEAIAESSGIAAMRLFREAASQEKRDINLSLFSRNLLDAMLKNKNSLLYIEQSVYEHGFLGHMQYFRKAIFGDYRLVEAQGDLSNSPLDAYSQVGDEFDAEQIEVYGQCFLITVQDYLKVTSFYPHSFTLYRFMSGLVEGVKYSGFVEDDGDYISPQSPIQKLRVVTGIFQQMLRLFDGAHERAQDKDDPKNSQFIDRIAQQISSLIDAAIRLKQKDSSSTWTLHYSMIWDRFFNTENSGTISIQIRRKILRNIVSEIDKLRTAPNYYNTALYSFALNLAYFTHYHGKKSKAELQTAAFFRLVMAWTRRHFSTIVDHHPRAIQHMLPPNITYDKFRGVLIREYPSRLHGLQAVRTTEFQVDVRPRLAY